MAEGLSREQAAALVGRAFGVLFLAWALVDVTYLPGEVLRLIYDVQTHAQHIAGDDLVASSKVSLICNLLRIIGFAIAGWAFWDGAGVRKLLSRRGTTDLDPIAR